MLIKIWIDDHIFPVVIPFDMLHKIFLAEQMFSFVHSKDFEKQEQFSIIAGWDFRIWNIGKWEDGKEIDDELSFNVTLSYHKKVTFSVNLVLRLVLE